MCHALRVHRSVAASQVADNPEDTPSGDAATVPAAVQVDPEVDATCCPSLLLTMLTHSPVVLKHTPVVLCLIMSAEWKQQMVATS